MSIFRSLRSCSALPLVAGLSVLVLGAPAWGQEAEGPRYLRVVEEEGKSIRLEVAARRFERAEGEGPEVCLVSVAHIGDRGLYRSLQKLLDGFDVVLYESVKPAGAARPGGKTDEERIASTRASLQFIAGVVESNRHHKQAVPATLDELRQSIESIDPRLSEWTALASIDAWGTAVLYARDTDGGYSIRSLGADGKEGGEGANADLIVTGKDGVAALASSKDDGLQAQLAKALNLDFQLEAMDYGRPHYRCSDMTMDQMNRAMKERGVDFMEFGGTLAGTSLPARMVNLLLQAIRLFDAMADGMMSDMVKVVMIEVLGNESITEGALNQRFGRGFGEVIVGERNQVVMDDLAELLKNEPDVRSVAIFYGAAHMKDFEERLAKQLGYAPTTVEWISAIEVDLANSAVDPAQLASIRRMMKSQLRNMTR